MQTCVTLNHSYENSVLKGFTTCNIDSGGASSENSPGPGKVLKYLTGPFIGAYLGVRRACACTSGGGVCRRSHLNPFAINHLNQLLHFVNLIVTDI